MYLPSKSQEMNLFSLLYNLDRNIYNLDSKLKTFDSTGKFIYKLEEKFDLCSVKVSKRSASLRNCVQQDI